MDLGLKGKRALVAAASRGLGLATAKALAAEGARLAICSSSQSIFDAASELANEFGEEIEASIVDVTDEGEAASWVAESSEKLGGIDILITNAGGPPPGNALETTRDQYRKAFELNCLSAIAMCGAAVPSMRASGWGRIAAITSIAVRQPPSDLAASSVARAGLTAYLKLLSREVAADGVTVNSIQPGYHATDRLLELGREGLERHIPAHRLGSPSDFGAVVTMLCSEQAGYLTGASIPIDGGLYPGLI